jgi:hypothetical protein
MDPVSNNKGGEPRSISLGQRPTASNHAGAPHKSGKKGNMMKAVMALVVIVVVAVGAFVIMTQPKATGTVDNSSYQAVFLTNGQVYFGKLHNANGDYLQLTDIFYLQTPTTTVQPSSSTDTSSQTQLVKLGNELHGPQDSMQISSKQVLFWENLKTSGKVVQAIDAYKP